MDEKIWDTPQKILVILAHPDDPEFFCGASIARWTQENNEVIYCLLTKGDKGANKHFKYGGDLTKKRREEQILAAKELGVNDILYLDYEDGYLNADLSLRLDIVRIIRKIKPDIVVTCDPTNLFFNDTYINHPDHRAAGQAVLDAVFPAAQNPLFFPQLINENLQPHDVKEIWVTLPKEPNITFDVTSTWQKKLSALLQHQSQIGDKEKFLERMRERRTETSTEENPHFEETFRRIKLRNH